MSVGVRESKGMDNWIPLSERVPPREHDVLVVSQDGRMWVAFLCDWETCQHLHYQQDAYGVNYVPDPTHWRELPEPPVC